MYLTYTEYGGTLEEPTFNDLEFQAESKVDWYTFDRLHQTEEEEYPEKLKRCMYVLIKLLNELNQLNGIGITEKGQIDTGSLAIASQSNDGVSISYNTLNASDLIKKIDGQIDDTIKTYLNSVTNSLGKKLLYRGLYPDE